MQDGKNLPYVNFIYLILTPNVLINEFILWVMLVMYQIFECQYSIKEYGLIILLCFIYIYIYIYIYKTSVWNGTKRKNGHYHTVLKQTIREAETSANPNLELQSHCSFVTADLDRNYILIIEVNCNILTCCKYTGPIQLITNILLHTTSALRYLRDF